MITVQFKTNTNITNTRIINVPLGIKLLLAKQISILIYTVGNEQKAKNLELFN